MSMTLRIHPKKLLVEGANDTRVIPELLERNNVLWGDSKEEAVVFIKECGGIENMMEPGFISTELKASGVETVGIIVDANSDAEARWNLIRMRASSVFPELPQHLPLSGLVHENDDGLKLGVWLMPDNQSHGMMETFLMLMASSKDDELATLAARNVADAKQMGAPFKDAHFDKAVIHTWLAWRDEPGRQLHQAVKESILDVTSPVAQPFVSWFRKLFDL